MWSLSFYVKSSHLYYQLFHINCKQAVITYFLRKYDSLGIWTEITDNFTPVTMKYAFKWTVSSQILYFHNVYFIVGIYLSYFLFFYRKWVFQFRGKNMMCLFRKCSKLKYWVSAKHLQWKQPWSSKRLAILCLWEWDFRVQNNF